MSAPSLRCAGLTVRLGTREVLSGLDLVLEPGRLTVVAGPNGAGKSTLLKALAGLIAPSAGAVALDREPLRLVDRRLRARTIAYLPQNGTVAWPIPVAAVVALGRMPRGESARTPTEAGRRAVAAALQAVGLSGFEERPATELSGGERARVLLARALAAESPILLADEPVAALDPRYQLLALDALRERARRGALVAAVMHDLALAARYADEIVLLRDGRLAAAGEPRAVLTASRLAEVFGIDAHVAETDDGLAITPRRALAESSGRP